jgi:hypothetical protein
MCSRAQWALNVCRTRMLHTLHTIPFTDPPPEYTITAIAPSNYVRQSLNYYLDARELPITIVFTALPPRLPPVTLDACQSAACRSGTLS